MAVTNSPRPPRTPVELLDREAQQTEAALRSTWRRTHSDARAALDVRRWAAAHPWWTVGAAAVTGFLAMRWLRGPSARPGSQSDSGPPTEARSAAPRRLASFWGLVAPHILPPLAAAAQQALETALRNAYGAGGPPDGTTSSPPTGDSPGPQYQDG
jgi:hypothetical protein